MDARVSVWIAEGPDTGVCGVTNTLTVLTITAAQQVAAGVLPVCICAVRCHCEEDKRRYGNSDSSIRLVLALSQLPS